jgi:hypothetical protein
MTRIQKFERRYGPDAGTVLSSIAKVARAGRTGDPGRIEAERQRHYDLMGAWRDFGNSGVWAGRGDLRT